MFKNTKYNTLYILFLLYRVYINSNLLNVIDSIYIYYKLDN